VGRIRRGFTRIKGEKMDNADPIFAAIAAHKESATALESVFAGLPTAIDPERVMAGQEKLVEAVPAERQALLALTSVTPATRLGWSALSDYVEQLKARTLWASHDPGADLIATLGENVMRCVAV